MSTSAIDLSVREFVNGCCTSLIGEDKEKMIEAIQKNDEEEEEETYLGEPEE